MHVPKMLFWGKHLLWNNLKKKINFKQVQITTSMVEIMARQSTQKCFTQCHFPGYPLKVHKQIPYTLDWKEWLITLPQLCNPYPDINTT